MSRSILQDLRASGAPAGRMTKEHAQMKPRHPAAQDFDVSTFRLFDVSTYRRIAHYILQLQSRWPGIQPVGVHIPGGISKCVSRLQ
jgi:hypothetical protein